MPRFVTNRWWTFILALTLGIVLVAGSVGPVRADNTGKVGSDDPTFNPDAPPPGSGDPDVPIGTAKSTQQSGLGNGIQSGGNSLRSAGDGRQSDSALVWRLQVVMRTLRGFILRY
jgi:hypothetical protein